MKRRVMAVLQTSDVMCLCVFLLCAGLHFTAGCTGESSVISCSPGESVLLHCRDENSQHKDAQWQRSDLQESQNPVNVIKDQRYKDRVQIHRNLSLSITRLTVDDAGTYWCKFTEPVHLIIEGCSLSGNEASVSISRYSGESVFLSCLVKCSGNHKPDKIRWKLPNNREINHLINPTELNRLYQGRFHMFGKNTGNFSLLISNLTEKDEGLYSCWINENQHKSFNLTIKGCVSSKHPNNIISYPGESVTLPCSCEDPKTKPKHVEWKRAALNETLVSDSKDVSGRFQILRDSPHNLSLRISNLTETDGGLYVCTVNGKQSRRINLTVTDLSKSLLKYSLMFLICLTLLLLTGFICWRYAQAKKGRRGTRVTQRPDPRDDVTYSTVMKINRGKPAENHQQDDVTYSSVKHIKGGKRTCRKEEEVVYSTMADASNGRSAQDDVTSSSVVCSKSHKPRSLQMNTEEAVYASVQKHQT